MISRRDLPEERIVRAGQPWLRAVVPRAHGVAAGQTRRAKRLIAIFQRGAVDGLSVIYILFGYMPATYIIQVTIIGFTHNNIYTCNIFIASLRERICYACIYCISYI